MRAVQTSQAPHPIGPYSQGIIEGGFIFTSGMIALDPATSKIIPGGIQEQTRRLLDNVKAVLAEAGSSLDRVTKTTVYLKDPSLFKEMNEIYMSYFQQHKPARSTIVCNFMLPEVLLEIDAIAKT